MFDLVQFLENTNISSILAGFFALAGTATGFFLNYWLDSKKEANERKKYCHLFKSDLEGKDRKISHLMDKVRSESQYEMQMRLNPAVFFNQFNFDELTRFYDMNYERLYYFNGDAVKKVNDVYFHIKNAKEYFESKRDAQTCYNELDWAIKGIKPAIKALDDSL